MPHVVAAFRRPVSPRAVTRPERALLRLGAGFDDFMIRRWMRADAPRPGVDPLLRDHLQRAHAFYRDPRFLAEPERFFAVPAEPAGLDEARVRALPDGACVDVSFASGFRPVYEAAEDDFGRFGANRRAHARWWRHDGGRRTTVICLHGYGSGDPRIDGLAFGVRRLYRQGFDVLLYTLPFHGRRGAGRDQKSGEAFFGPDLARTNEAFAQIVFEVRTLVLLLSSRGPVGTFGMSLGAYATALLAAIEPRLAFAIAMIPVAALPELVWGEPLHRHRRQELEAHGVGLTHHRETWQVHAPLLRNPVVPRHRRFVIGALGDRICPPAHAHALWSHWQEPGVHWYAGGHLAQFRRGKALAAARAFLRHLDLASG